MTFKSNMIRIEVLNQPFLSVLANLLKYVMFVTSISTTNPVNQISFINRMVAMEILQINDNFVKVASMNIFPIQQNMQRYLKDNTNSIFFCGFLLLLCIFCSCDLLLTSLMNTSKVVCSLYCKYNRISNMVKLFLAVKIKLSVVDGPNTTNAICILLMSVLVFPCTKQYIRNQYFFMIFPSFTRTFCGISNRPFQQ